MQKPIKRLVNRSSQLVPNLVISILSISALTIDSCMPVVCGAAL
ncbi:hypothetical protein [Niastella vici]|nr:hypothetical protein [Niastella vici]